MDQKGCVEIYNYLEFGIIADVQTPDIGYLKPE